MYPDAGAAIANDYRHDSPDLHLYDLIGESAIKNPFRSAARNTRNFNNVVADPRQDPLPFGLLGADEAGFGLV